VLPLTFHTQNGMNDPDYKLFESYFRSLEQKIKAVDE
jgi:hypothetical protein